MQQRSLINTIGYPTSKGALQVREARIGSLSWGGKPPVAGTTDEPAKVNFNGKTACVNHDGNGNIFSEGVRIYGWDADYRLVKSAQAGTITRRVGICTMDGTKQIGKGNHAVRAAIGWCVEGDYFYVRILIDIAWSTTGKFPFGPHLLPK